MDLFEQIFILFPLFYYIFYPFPSWFKVFLHIIVVIPIIIEGKHLKEPIWKIF